MTDLKAFIENFLLAVDFQEHVNLTPETQLQDLPEWDSLAALGVIVMFDMEYGKSITGDQLQKISTIGDLFVLTGL
jgi:acyl carrier protein